MRVVIFCILFLISSLCISQSQDSTRHLDEVVIHGFGYQKPINEVPASVAVLKKSDLERFDNASFLSSINTVPGVRMEERSPGSYRLSIRGSSLRSPFGIRNVKFYWNNLPLTDGGGNTYFNLLDFNSISHLEIIKGPAGSLYGAGTGGAILLSTTYMRRNEIQVSASGGSYGIQRYQVNATSFSKKLKTSINFAHQQSDGYREQTKLRRDALNLNFELPLTTKGTLATSLFYTELFYQTPGGLTKAQYDANPQQARTATRSLPSAIEQQAAIYNQTLFGGLTYDHQWDEQWVTKIGVYGSTTQFKNPAISNYEKRTEENWGGRTETQYSFNKTKWSGRLTIGAEYQSFSSPISNYANLQGNPGNLQFDDRLKSTLLIAFSQFEINLPKNYFLTLGASSSFIHYQFKRVSVNPTIEQKRNFDPVVSPRIALLKKLTDQFSVYATISKGFSPPTLAEVRPSTNNYNDSLKAETGVSYEIGIRGNLFKPLSFEVALYSFLLDETIVMQRQINNADYFINAGSSSQKGAEATISWTPISQSTGSVSSLKVWTSYTLNHYRFSNYIKNQQDYSGNQLTGVTPTTVVSGIDFQFNNKIYVRSTCNFTDRIPLNDANSEFASEYFLVGARIGYTYQVSPNLPIELWLGIDNAFDQKYSLGNDLNAAGGRYYNAAAGRNFYFGLKIAFRK